MMMIRRRFRVRHGRRPPRAAALWLQLVPFVLVLAIFYFIILLPMKRKQQKVQEFLDSLKVDDGSSRPAASTGRSRASASRVVQLQIADKVRIEVVARRPSAATRARRRSSRPPNP